MNDHRTVKRRPQEQRGQERKLQAERGQRRDEHERERKEPSPIERREWRGSGVCGDRHTD